MVGSPDWALLMDEALAIARKDACGSCSLRFFEQCLIGRSFHLGNPYQDPPE